MARPSSSDFVSLSALLPSEVAVEEGWVGDIAGQVWPEESAHVAAAVASRRAEFCAGRIMARRALARLGGGDAPIVAREDRAPIWPAGYTGSISHTSARVAAAVGVRDEFVGIGIDIEEVGRFRPDLERHILRQEEIAANLDGRAPEARRSALALIFSIKEAFYKCQYTVTGQFLGFHDARVGIDLARGEFELTVLNSLPGLPGRVFQGRFAMDAGGVAAAMVLRQDGRR